MTEASARTAAFDAAVVTVRGVRRAVFFEFEYSLANGDHFHGSHAHQRGVPVTIRHTPDHASPSTTDLYLSSAPTDGSSLYLKF